MNCLIFTCDRQHSAHCTLHTAPVNRSLHTARSRSCLSFDLRWWWQNGPWYCTNFVYISHTTIFYTAKSEYHIQSSKGFKQVCMITFWTSTSLYSKYNPGIAPIVFIFLLFCLWVIIVLQPASSTSLLDSEAIRNWDFLQKKIVLRRGKLGKQHFIVC